MSKKIYKFISILLLSFIVGVNNIEAKKISEANVGDYIKITPTSASYTIPTSLTGYTSDQTVNPKELNLWVVLRKNSDGSVDIVSKYASSTKIFFYGTNGYMNLVGGLNTIASQYTNEKYVIKTRHMGYSDQIEKCMELSTSGCPGDTGYETDTNLVINSIGTLEGTSPNGTATSYFLTSRYIISSSTSSKYDMRYIDTNGKIENSTLFFSNDTDGVDSAAIRPILTLKGDTNLPTPVNDGGNIIYDLDSLNEEEKNPSDNDNQGNDNIRDEQNNGKNEEQDKDSSLKNEIDNPNTGNFFVCVLFFTIVILVVIVLNINKTRKIFKL